MAHLESNRERSTPEFTRPVLSRSRLPGVWMSAAIFLALIGSWELGVRMGWITALFFPAPSTIMATVGAMFSKGIMLNYLAITLWRMTLGLLIGGLSGLLLGLLMGWQPALRQVVEPFISATHPLPKIALLPLVMVIFGIGDAPIVIVAATGAFFPMIINTISGVLQIHPIHFDVAYNYGASGMLIFRRVVLPGSSPSILTGFKIAINTTLLLTVAVEMVSARVGLGSLIWMAWNTFRTEELYAALLMITLMGIFFNILVNAITARLLPWQVHN